MRYLVVVARMSPPSLRGKLAYRVYLPWRVCSVGAPVVPYMGLLPLRGVLVYLRYLVAVACMSPPSLLGELTYLGYLGGKRVH